MTTDEFRHFLATTDPPFIIHTYGGKSYPVSDPANFWVPGNYEGLSCVVVPGQGLTVLRQSAIESIQLEHSVSRQ